MPDIHSLMEACYAQGASDLHVSVARPPVLRVHGHLVEIEGLPVLTAADVDAMVAAITP
jgi:twitching motility protein PilT